MFTSLSFDISFFSHPSSYPSLAPWPSPSCLKYSINKTHTVMCWWINWLEHHPIQQKVAGSTLVQGTYLDCGEATYQSLSLACSLSLSLPAPIMPPLFSLSKINKHIPRWGFKKYVLEKIRQIRIKNTSIYSEQC